MTKTVATIATEEIDLLTLVAWSDSAHEGTRGSWRGFFSFFLQHLMTFDNDTSDAVVTGSIAESIEEMTGTPEYSIEFRVRKISSELAMFIGIPREFGYAAMLNTHLPTKLHAPNKKLLAISQDQILKHWMLELANAESTQEFQEQKNKWKSYLDEVLASLAQNDDETEEDTEENGEEDAEQNDTEGAENLNKKQKRDKNKDNNEDKNEDALPALDKSA